MKNKRWTKTELDGAIKLLKNNKNYNEIATLLNRTPKSVKVKLQKCGETYEKYNDYNTVIQCKECGKEIVISKKDKKRKFCGHSCSALFNNKFNKIDKYCENCNKLLSNKQKKFCSSKCQADFYYENYILEWKNGKNDSVTKSGELSNYIRRYIFDKYEHKCAKCGWGKTNK